MSTATELIFWLLACGFLNAVGTALVAFLLVRGALDALDAIGKSAPEQASAGAPAVPIEGVEMRDAA